MSTITNQDVNSNSNIINNDNYDSSLLPSADNTFDLGSSTLRWRDLFLGTQIVIGASSNQMIFAKSSTGPITLNIPNSSNLGGWTASLPDCQTASSFVMTSFGSGSQTISAPTIFNAGVGLSTNYLKATNTSNQLVLGTTNTTTLSATAPASSNTLTIPDARQNCNIISQSINGGLNAASTRPAVSGGSSLGGSFEIRGYSSGSLSYDDGFLRLRAGGGTDQNTATWIDLSGYSGVTDMNATIVFGTGGTERTRVNNSGLVVSGQTTLNNTGQSSHFTGVSIVNVNSWDNIWIQENSGTGKRAGMFFGGDGSGTNGWEIIQDSANDGTRNFVIVNDNAGNNAIVINTDSSATLLGPITVTNGPLKCPSFIFGVSAINSAITLGSSQSGQILQVSTAASDYTITLPNVQSSIAGYVYTFCFTNVTGSGNVTIYTATLHGLNGFGNGTAQYSKQQVKFNQSSLSVGDRAFFRCDGTSWTAEVLTGNSLALTWT